MERRGDGVVVVVVRNGIPLKRRAVRGLFI
jgi:hypothetical protein